LIAQLPTRLAGSGRGRPAGRSHSVAQKNSAASLELGFDGVSMADKKKAILLRITPDLWDRLNAWARDDLRSVNAQIEFLLREAVRKRFGKADTPPPSLPPSETDAPEIPPQA
jgi:hypothetical protein